MGKEKDDGRLTPNYLNELFAALIEPSNVDLMRVCASHVKFVYMPSDQYKAIFKAMYGYYNTTGLAPTFGMLSQEFRTDLKTTAILSQVKDTGNVNKEGLMKQLEAFIKEREFVTKYMEMADLFNSGKKKEAHELLVETASFISNLSLNGDSCVKLYESFEKRVDNRRMKEEDREVKGKTKRISSHIQAFDKVMNGGFERGHTYLGMAGSGKYKSTFLRHLGYNIPLRTRLNVLHLQAEDTEESTTEAYDQALSGQTLIDVELGNIEDDVLRKIANNIKRVKVEGGECFIHCFEKFDKPRMSSCLNIIRDVERRNNIKIDVVLWDYLELFEPDTKYHDERERRLNVANEMKNISMETDVASVAVTQAMDVSEALIEIPDFVMTRNHISEMKGLLKPFSGFFTFNQTSDEYKENLMRIYFDKIRKAPAKKLIKLYMAPEFGKFYDAKKTISLLSLEAEIVKKPQKKKKDEGKPAFDGDTGGDY